MASVVVTVDEDYDLMHVRCEKSADAFAIACLGDLQSNDTQTFLLTLERTCSLNAHYIDLTYESLSELQGNPNNLGSDTNGATLVSHCEY